MQNRHLNIDALAHTLLGEFEEARNARELVNLRWLEDLRQYKGIYSADVLQRLNDNKRSKVFYRLTTNKVDTMVSRLMELVFPQRAKNWSIEPTPNPAVKKEVLLERIMPEVERIAEPIFTQTIQSLLSQRIQPDEKALENLYQQALAQAYSQVDKKSAVLAISQERAEKMETTIDDQIKENIVNGIKRLSWQDQCRHVVFNSCLYGIGILKGPLVQVSSQENYLPQESGEWAKEVTGEKLVPFYESVSPWDIFPDPSALSPEQLRYVWQKHTYTDKDLINLSLFPGFKREKILTYMAEFPDGDSNLDSHEQSIRDINPDNTGLSYNLKNRYTVYERWGYIKTEELEILGLEMPEGYSKSVFPACIYLLGNRIIKANLNPIEGLDLPFFFYPFSTDDTSFFPEGIASRLRGPQAAINSSVRAMQDNAAASSGPIYGVNVSALPVDEDINSMISNRVIHFSKAGTNINDVLQTFNVPSHIEHNLSTVKFWQEAGDEISTPRFNAGDGRVSGAGETASGLSMLMGASNILLKDHVKIFDDKIISPFITALFNWNMQFNDDEDIKGDFSIFATGSQSLIAKEIRMQQVPMIINMLANPAFAPHIKSRQVLEVALEQTDLPCDRILRSKEEAERYEQEQQMQAMQMQAQANVQALVEEIERRGADPQAVVQELGLMLQQATQQQV